MPGFRLHQLILRQLLSSGKAYASEIFKSLSVNLGLAWIEVNINVCNYNCNCCLTVL